MLFLDFDIDRLSDGGDGDDGGDDDVVAVRAIKYPLVLNSGSRVPYYTHSKLRDLPWLNQFMPEPVVRLHPDDAEARGIADGDPVRVYNQFGEVQMKAEVTNLVLPGEVDVFHGWQQADINLLTSRDFDPITGFPPFRSAPCEVAPVA